MERLKRIFIRMNCGALPMISQSVPVTSSLTSTVCSFHASYKFDHMALFVWRAHTNMPLNVFPPQSV